MAKAVLLAILAGVLTVDLLRPPQHQVTAAGLLAAIDLYQEQLSPRMAAAGVRCRFQPTCSHYAEAVIGRDGALIGSWRAALRVARCGPWVPAGTEDQP